MFWVEKDKILFNTAPFLAQLGIVTHVWSLQCYSYAGEKLRFTQKPVSWTRIPLDPFIFDSPESGSVYYMQIGS